MSRRIFSIVLILGLLTSSLLLIKPQQNTQAQTDPTVRIANMSFQPASLTINVGQIVTWTNNDSMAHTITSDTGVWNSGTVNPGGSFSFTFTTAGTYTYHCSFHSSMTGTIIVTSNSSATPVAPTKTITRTNTPITPAVTQTGSPTRTPTLTPVSTLPDLTVSSITYIGSNPTCANNPKVQVVVANIGSVAVTGTFSVAVSGNLAQTVNGLAAGQSVTLIFSAGSATATVDSTNVITESNESNNSLTGNFGVPTQAHTCTPSAPTFTPTRTPTPTGSVTTVITNTPTRTPTLTVTKTPTVCPMVSGYVRLGSSTGPGIAGVHITATFQGSQTTATTDTTGHYFLPGCGIQGMVITPQLSGYTFTPTQQTYMMFASSVDFVGTTSPVLTPTPTATIPSSVCSPVTSTITVPFTFDGAGIFCWQASALGTYVNSWNTNSVTINGVNETNLYVASGSYPAKVNGFYYIGYNSSVAWGHLETK